MSASQQQAQQGQPPQAQQGQPPPPQPQPQQQQPNNMNADPIDIQDKQNSIGQATAAQPGTLGGYETVPKDDGLVDERDKLGYTRSED